MTLKSLTSAKSSASKQTLPSLHVFAAASSFAFIVAIIFNLI